MITTRLAGRINVLVVLPALLVTGLIVEYDAEADMSGRAVGAGAGARGDAIAVAVGAMAQIRAALQERSPAARAASLRALAARASERTRKASAHHSQVFPTMLKRP